MSNNIKISFNDALRIVGVNSCAFAAVFLIPTISHMSSLPLFLMEPMRIILFSLIIAEPNYRGNQYIIAATMPLASYLLSGHPILAKSIIMSVELLVNVITFNWLLRKMSIFKSVILSILASKTIYYLLKWLLISGGLIQMEIVSTDLLVQLIVIILLAFTCKILYVRKSV